MLGRTKKTSPPPGPPPWPQFGPDTPARLEGALNGFFAAQTISACQGPVEALMGVANVNISPLEKTGRSLWSWYLAWIRTSSPPPGRLRAQFGLFADEYHDSFARQANAMAVAVLGKATEEQLGEILSDAFTSLGQLDPGSLVVGNHPVSVSDLQRAWSQQLGRPIQVLAPATDDGDAGTVLEQALAEAEAGDESQAAMIAAVMAQNEGRLEEALGYLEHGARLGNVDAMLGAADVARELGRQGVERFWTETAAKTGHPTAMFNMGLSALYDGDLREASRWLEASGSSGNAEAYAALIEVADRAHEPRAQARWAEIGARQNHPRCLEVHALNVLRGNEENPEIFRQALSLMEAAASMGYAAAMYRCGIFHCQGGNPVQAKYWWEQAEAAGVPEARGRLVQYGLA
jgi:hypothetical protein